MIEVDKFEFILVSICIASIIAILIMICFIEGHTRERLEKENNKLRDMVIEWYLLERKEVLEDKEVSKDE